MYVNSNITSRIKGRLKFSFDGRSATSKQYFPAHFKPLFMARITQKP